MPENTEPSIPSRILPFGLPEDGQVSDEASQPGDCHNGRDVLAGLRGDAQEAIIAESVNVLSKSRSAEHLLAAALLAGDSTERHFELLSSAERTLDSPLAAWHRLRNCRDRSCDRKAVALRGLSMDSSNGAFWTSVAQSDIEDRNWVAAAASLEKAVSATRFDTYFADTVMLLERGLAASSNLNYTERYAVAMGHASAQALPEYKHLMDACKSSENEDGTWVSLCRDLGNMMAANSDDVVSTMIGYTLVRIAAERSGDLEYAARLEKENRDAYRGMKKVFFDSGADNLMVNDPRVAAMYLEVFASHGELAAIRAVAKEAERLRNDETYDQCNFEIRPSFSR